MMRKLTAIISILALLLSLFSGYVSAETASETDYSFFLECLNITDSIDKERSDSITRAEFTAMVVRMIKSEDLPVMYEGFNDVDSNTSFSKEIYVAKALRIANGTSSTEFSPDEPIMYNAAIKEIVIALGYEHEAEMKGSYPSGYLSVASRLKIGISVTNRDVLTYGDAITMVYNSLHAPLMKQDGLKGDDIIYKTDDRYKGYF